MQRISGEGTAKKKSINRRVRYSSSPLRTLDHIARFLGSNYSAQVVHRPRLLSDNGPSYVADDLATWLDDHGIGHVRGAPNHPRTQGKIERWHQTLKNRILLENYFLPGDLEAHIGDFGGHYNHVSAGVKIPH